MQNSSNPKSASPPPEGKAWYQLTVEESLQHLNSREEGLSQKRHKSAWRNMVPMHYLPEKQNTLYCNSWHILTMS